jgi:hypothetical protein
MSISTQASTTHAFSYHVHLEGIELLPAVPYLLARNVRHRKFGNRFWVFRKVLITWEDHWHFIQPSRPVKTS